MPKPKISQERLNEYEKNLIASYLEGNHTAKTLFGTVGNKMNRNPRTIQGYFSLETIRDKALKQIKAAPAA